MEKNENRSAAVGKYCLRKNRKLLVFLLLTVVLNMSIFWLYGLKMEPFLYTTAVLVVLAGISLIMDWVQENKKAEERSRILASPLASWNSFSEPDGLPEEDYQEMIRMLGKSVEELYTRFDNEQQDTLDYYTAWVHQIKTPIAVMRLQLSTEDTDENRALLSELFRIEQYVDMVLQYVRLGSKTTDLVITEYSLDDLIRETIRKYASSFIQKRLRMDFQPTGRTIITDKKWFCLILEQFLSNAIKYTQTGGITIRLDDKNRLCITDSGIGIAEEDLPRIFDKGFTGKNGRIGQKSSGLGLYLAKRASELIRRPVGVESRVGEGSSFWVSVNENDASADSTLVNAYPRHHTS